MRKPTGHKEKYSIKSVISKIDSNDETAAQTRPLSFDEIMLKRKNKKKSGNVEDQRVVSEVVASKDAESVISRLESGRHRHRHRDVVGGSEQNVSKDELKTREDKMHKSEYKESNNAHIRSKIVSDNVKDKTNERGVHEKRKNQDRSTDDIDHEHGKRRGKETDVKDRDRNVERNKEKSENVSKRRTENEYDERDRDHDAGKKHESRKGYNSNTSERKQQKGTSVAHREDLKSKYDERDRDQDVGKKHEPRKVYDCNTSERKQQKATFESHHEDLKSKYDERDQDVGKKHESRKLYDSNTSERKQQKGTFESNHENLKSKYDERDRDQDFGKKHEPRNLYDSSTSERKQQKGTSETRREDSKSRSKRSRSREDERDKRKKSNSPFPRGLKQKSYETRGHEKLSSHSSKDREKISNNGSSNKSKRHDTSASHLGGYSPRKRRSETAVKTPSPISHSPEKKNTWDSPPVKLESNLSLLNKTEVSNKQEVSSVPPLTPSILKPSIGVISSIPLMMNASVDSVQLTQATRPKRRIYVENLPSSASEAAVKQWLSGYLRLYGVNHVQSTSPCISCIVNKEKGQALVEFLTPEDASTALRFDGRSFSGNIIKIRRPKDYVEATTGVSDKPVAVAVSVRNVVEDSSNKIFISGISKVITSEMLMEIASAFGPLKAYHFEDNTHLGSSCAFVEYADQSVTIKACVGLNGMKLGGHVLTVTQATPDASSVGNHDEPFYGTPVHAQPLLEEPTQVLKFNNVVDLHNLPSLSESELEEIVEDIRLECARFGMVKSINIIKQTDMLTSSETIKVAKDNSMVDEVTELSESDQEQHEEVNESAPIGGINECVGANVIAGNKHENKIMKNEIEDTTMVDSPVENQNLEENSNQISYEIDQLELNDSKPTDDIVTENKTLKAKLHDTVKDDLPGSNVNFEAGCVLVEYKRREASSMAAHCLHGRVFDGRSVTVEYVAHDVYCSRFCK